MNVKTTNFHPLHIEASARMISFAGFEMPIHYPTGILKEHATVRSGVGVFDVSHMGEFIVKGQDALDLIQYVTINDASKLTEGKAQYSAFCNDSGGVVDDLIVYHCGDHYMLVVNGANIEKDWAWLLKHASSFQNVECVDISNEINLLAIQGPASLDVVQRLTEAPVVDIPYYGFVRTVVGGTQAILSRTGYTGELGVEVYFRGTPEVCRDFVHQLFQAGAAEDIAWIGLGARDSLRLEKGYCLYGNDITDDTNPIEAGLGWITKPGKGDFVGRDVIVKVKELGPVRKLVGFRMTTEKLIPRNGYGIEVAGASVGFVTSGCMSAALKCGIGMGYVATDLAAPGTHLDITARNTTFSAEVVKPPFV